MSRPFRRRLQRRLAFVQDWRSGLPLDLLTKRYPFVRVKRARPDDCKTRRAAKAGLGGMP